MSKLHPIKAGVPQGSVLGPILYILFTADLPLNNRVLIGIFADDTAVLAVDKNPVEPSKKLQKNLDEVGTRTSKGGIKMNETKSVHITFTTRTESCPPVYINNTENPSSNEVKYVCILTEN